MDGTFMDGPGSMSRGLLAFGYVEVTASVICTALRAYGARTSHGKLRWDFIWVLLASCLGVIALGAATMSIKNGLSNHILNLPNYAQAATAMRWFWIAIYFGLPAMACAKLSIVALLLNVQGPNAVKRTYVLWFVGFLIMSTSLILIPLIIWGCTPIERLWDITLPGNCNIQYHVAVPFAIMQGTISAVSDVVLALWPISIVWHLKTSRRVKIGFCALMAIGILPAIASVVRTTMLPRMHFNPDITYSLGTFLFWASAECMAVIVLGSIPPLRPLFLRVFYGVKSNVVSSSSRGSKPSPTSQRRDYTGGNGRSLHTNIDGGKDVGIHLSQSNAFSDDSSSEREDGRIFITREVNVEKMGRARLQEV